MLATDFALKRIRAYVDKQGWKKSRLATEAKLHDTTLRDFDKEDWNPSLRILRTVESVVPENFMPPPKCRRKPKNGNGRRGE
jgi:ribosome-binding protein aMBF1 (putative translation factor)